MVEERLESHEIAQNLWDEYKGIRGRICELLVGDEVTEEQEILAAVCVHYLIRIFGPNSPINVQETQTVCDLEFKLGFMKEWKIIGFTAEAEHYTLSNIDGLYKRHQGKSIGMALYIYCILKCHSKGAGLVSNTRMDSARKVWLRLIELGLAEPIDGGENLKRFADSVPLSFLPENADEVLKDLVSQLPHNG